MLKTGILGGAGYTAGELLRILLHHPQVKPVFVHSQSQAGKKITEIHSDLWGETDLVFTNELNFNQIELLFLCVGHGEAKKFLAENQITESVKIIDLSQDFRTPIASPQPSPLEREKKTPPSGAGGLWIYGLPELNKELIQKADKIANPGCFATAIQLALLPLAKAQLLKNEVHIQGITGSTGAGQKPTDSTHFSWRNNNISVYKAFEHQHLTEIRQSIRQLQPDFDNSLNFIPVRGNFSRGILATLYTESSLSLAEAKQLFENYYRDSPFVFLATQNPDLKQVVNTNKCILYLEKHNNKLFIISIIDNLLKGASGQAVQNMNLMFGLEESLGLKLKGIGF